MNFTTKKNWKTVKLGEVAEVIPGYAFRGEDFRDTGFPIVKITEIQPPYVSFEKSKKVDIEKYNSERIAKYKLKRGDYVVAMTGATIGKVGKIVDDVEGYLNQRVAKIQAKENFDNKFVYYQVFSDRFFKYIQQVSAGSSAQQNVSGADIEKYEISLPESLDEQREIAGVLGCLDDKIELLRKENKTLEEMAQVLFKEWFVNFNFPGATGRMIDSELGKIPEGWRVGKLGELFKITMGQSPDGESYNESKDGMIFYQGRTDFGERFPSVRLYTTEPKRTAEAFDVLVSVRAPVGDLNQATEKCCLGRGIAGVSSDLKSFCFYMMKSVQTEIQKFEAGGTVFGSINKADFENIKVVIPPQGIQENFDLLGQPIDKKIFNNFSEIQTLSKLRNQLLNMIFSN